MKNRFTHLIILPNENNLEKIRTLHIHFKDRCELINNTFFFVLNDPVKDENLIADLCLLNKIEKII